MLAALLPFLKKLWPYVVGAGICCWAGCYAGYHFESGAVQAGKLALAAQQKNDATAIADANAIAASDLAQADARANAAQAALAAKIAESGAWETTLTTEIGAQAAMPGKDAADAPVLSATLDAIAKGNP